jgi:Ras-related protein Rab-1A
VTNMETFNNVQSWLQKIERYACENVFVILAGNRYYPQPLFLTPRTDLVADRRVTFDVGHEFACTVNLALIETSAKTNSNVNELFYTVAKKLKEKLED